VSSLDVIAEQAITGLAMAPGDEVLVVTDARRREVYWARYAVSGFVYPPVASVTIRAVAGPGVGRAVDVAAGHPVPTGQMTDIGSGRLWTAGEGAAGYPEIWPPTPGAPLIPDLGILGRLALQRHAAGQQQPVEPLYLRRPDIHEPTGGVR
jgi:tRNA threonylcarbamoyladenosine biosynthesis protein TsaB